MAKKSAKSAKPLSVKQSSAAKKTTSKKSSVKPKPKELGTSRRLKSDWLQRFRFRKPIKHHAKLPTTWQLTKTSALTLWQNKGVFLSITGVYALLNLVFVQGLTNSANTASLKSTLSHVSASHIGSIISGLGTFITLSGSSATPTSGLYQLILGLITTLAVIWALRQLSSGKSIGIRDGYYRGMYPIIPFILVLLVICVQLLPFVVGAKIYTTVITGGIAVNVIEKVGSLLLFLAFALWSLYMIGATIFALYIVTLPDMTPIRAIRLARELVRHRRFTLLRRVLTLPLILFIVTGIIMLPIIFVLPGVAPWVLFLLSMAELVAANGYMYTLYRELLNE
jgi:hypothetical protein